MSNDNIEFYGPKGENVARVESSMVPPVGSLISIAKVTWEVVFVTFALDHANDHSGIRAMRCNVELKKAKP